MTSQFTYTVYWMLIVHQSNNEKQCFKTHTWPKLEPIIFALSTPFEKEKQQTHEQDTGLVVA